MKEPPQYGEERFEPMALEARQRLTSFKKGKIINSDMIKKPLHHARAIQVFYFPLF
jgi:hypothetical protein